MGNQHINTNTELRDKVFNLLNDLTPFKVNPNTGRMDMKYQDILVLGTLILACNWDYDKLKKIADNYNTLCRCWAYF